MGGASESEWRLKDLALPVADSRAQIFPDEPSNMFALLAFEVLHLPQSACAKDDALLNILFMLVTPDTSQLEMSMLNDNAESNI